MHHLVDALELPEVARIIAGYLSNLEPCLAGYHNNLGPCLTVCKAWRSLYLPYYWREVRAGELYERKDDSPPFDLTRHSHYRKFVQVLKVYSDYDPINQSLDYPNLRMLRLYYKRNKGWNGLDENPILKEFVSRHPLLECLDLSNIPHSVMGSTWTALVGHPCLVKVIVRSRTSLSDDFWKVCTQLRTLEFKHHTVSGPRHFPKDLVLPFILRLELVAINTSNVMELLDIVVACPLLEDLDWEEEEHYMHPVWARFGQLATQGAWPHLQQLSMVSWADDVDLAQIIASMHHATKIKIGGCSFGPLSFAALKCHFNTLQHLRAPNTMDSKMIQEVLCTFARLEYLEAHCIDAKDIAEGDPWVCTNLREMLLMISFSSGEDHLQPVVFERISRLVHLEKFDNRIDARLRARPTHGLIFRLQSGMDALASLTRLRFVWWDPNIQAMNIDDARWIIDHWKRLELIEGYVNQNISIRSNLEVLFSRSGIELQMSPPRWRR